MPPVPPKKPKTKNPNLTHNKAPPNPKNLTNIEFQDIL